MSSRQGSGVRGQGSGFKDRAKRLAAAGTAKRLAAAGTAKRLAAAGTAKRLAVAGTAAFGPLAIAPRLLNPTVWLIALLASLVLTDVGRAEDSAAQRRRRIENMKPAEKKQLKRDYEWLMGLEPAERQRLQELHRQLNDNPQLRRVMHAYCEWLESLPAYVRTELSALKPDERIKRIQELRDQEAKRPKTPKPEDLEGLFRWMKQYAANPEHQDEILGARSGPGGQHSDDSRTSEERAWVTVQIMLRGLRMSRSGRPEWSGWPDSDRPDWLTEAELKELREQLSQVTRKRLARMSPDKQWEVISSWFQLSTWHDSLSQRFRRGTPPQELLERLDQFFEGLEVEEKDRLLNLPDDEMLRELEQMYVRQFWPMPGPPHGERPDGRKPGPPGPPPDAPRGPEKDPRPAGPGHHARSRER